MHLKKSCLLLPLAAAASLLTACGGGSAGTGTMNLGVTDAAVDGAAKVVVEFTGVELKPQGGAAIQFTLPAPRQIDLLNLNGGGSAELLQAVGIPAGTYNYIRLQLNAEGNAANSYIELLDGSISALRIPSGEQRGVQLNGQFVVPDGGIANFVIDFDLRKSVRNPPGQNGDYLLRPTVRIVNSDAVGTISGSIANERVAVEGCTPAVYVYAGSNYLPGDEGSATAPLTSALVSLDETSGSYRYTAAFLPPGNYTVAYTCAAALDSPDSDDDIVFESPTNATVSTDVTTTVDFAVVTPAP